MSLSHLVALAITSFSFPLTVFSFFFFLQIAKTLFYLDCLGDSFSESSLTHQSFSNLIFIWLGMVKPVLETFVFPWAHALAHVLANFFLAQTAAAVIPTLYCSLVQPILFFLLFILSILIILCQYTLRLSDLNVICFHMYYIIRFDVHSLYLVDYPIAQAIVPLHLPIN